jgi:iron complex outermembrane receptor protein
MPRPVSAHLAPCIGVVLALSTMPVRGEERVNAFPLPEILVTAPRVEAPTTLIVREVTPADIEAWNAHTAGDALKQVPGINVQYGGGSGDARAWIRGFRDRDTLVLVDGIPVASAFEGTIDLNEIAVASVSRINVIKTAPSLTYGVNGMAGIIDIIPRPRAEGRALRARIEQGGNDNRLYQASFEAGSPDLSYFIAGSHQSADDYELSDDYDGALNQPAGERLNSDFERDNLSLYARAADTPLGETSLYVSLSDVERGFIPQAGVEDPDFERLRESQRQTVGISNRFSAVPLSARLYYNGYDSEIATYTDASYSTIDEIEEASDYAVGLTAYGAIETAENNTVVFHTMLNRDVYKADGVLENADRVQLNTYTVSAENQYWVNRRLSLAVGGIFTWFEQEQSGDTLTAFNPQMVLAYQLNEALSLRASAAQRTRFPRLRELYRRRYGNPELKEQSANNYELAVQYAPAKGPSLDAAVFQSDLEDLIDRTDRRSLYQNLDSVTIRGIEAAASGWLGDTLFGRAAYTWVDAAESLADGGERQLRSRPEHTAMLELRLRLGQRMQWSLNGVYVAGLYDVDDAGTYLELDDYFVADSKFSVDFSEHWQGYLAVSNIADTDYEHKLGYPREGRTLLIGVRAAF